MRNTLFKKEIKKFQTIYFKNYSDLSDERQNKSLTQDDFGLPIIQNNIEQVFLSHHKKRVRGEQPVVFTRSHQSSEESHFEENYGNPLCEIFRMNRLFVIEQEGFKVSMKLFGSTSYRKVGKTYFRKSTRCDYITFNIKDGFLYSGHIVDYHKKRKCFKKVRKNLFYSSPVSTFLSVVKNAFMNSGDNSFVIDASVLFFKLCGIEKNIIYNSDDSFYLTYLDKMGIKYPNNFNVYRTTEYNTQPKLKEIRRSGGKLVDAFMKKNEINGKVLKKVLHDVEFINIPFYKSCVKWFGNDILNNDIPFLKKILEYKDTPFFNTTYSLKEIFTPSEFQNTLTIFKKIVSNNVFHLTSFFDHVRFYVELKAYGEENIRWNSTNIDLFHNEHLDWTDRVSKYKNGYYQRIYPEMMEKICCSSYNSGGIVYYPVLLKTSTEYNDESAIQSNCVRTYLGHCSSIIFSLRKFDKNSKERLTAEYTLYMENDKVKVKMIQDRIRFNQNPTEEWKEALEILNKRVEKYVNSKFYENVKIEKECMNGAKLMSDSVWFLDRLEWENGLTVKN
jgi:hypothetical protein